jgi:hypothetical protein
MQLTNEKRKRRVAVAQDVIDQLKAKRTVAARGVYLSGLRKKHLEGDFQEVLTGKGAPRCQVCALGAFFLSYVRRHDKFDLKKKAYLFGGAEVEMDAGDMRAALTVLFSQPEMQLIEAAFEGFNRGALNHLHQLIASDKRRLIHIARHIIQTNGDEFNVAACEALAKRALPSHPKAAKTTPAGAQARRWAF